VYKGNYPNFIEDALEKRGVWKKFDIQLHFQKLQEVQSQTQGGLSAQNSITNFLKSNREMSQTTLQKQYDHQMQVQQLLNAYPASQIVDGDNGSAS